MDGNLIIEQDASKPSGCHDNKGVDKEPDRLSPSPAVSNLSSSSSSEKCMDNVESSETVDEEMSSMLTILDATLHLPPPEQFRESTAEPKEAFLQGCNFFKALVPCTNIIGSFCWPDHIAILMVIRIYVE